MSWQVTKLLEVSSRKISADHHVKTKVILTINDVSAEGIVFTLVYTNLIFSSKQIFNFKLANTVC